MKDWQQAEKKHAKASGERLVPRSGAGFQKGDTQGNGRLTECKSSMRKDRTGQSYIVVQSEWFAKVLEEADLQGVEPAIALIVGPGLERFVFIPAGDVAEEDLDCAVITLAGDSYTAHLYTLRMADGILVKGELWLKEI